MTTLTMTVLAARWWWAGRRARRAADRAWVAGADLLRAWATPVADSRRWPEPATQERCTCGARRCANKARGVYCEPQRAPQLTQTLGGAGRHERSYREPVDRQWSPLALAVRVFLAPTVYAARLPVPARAAGRLA